MRGEDLLRARAIAAGRLIARDPSGMEDTATASADILDFDCPRCSMPVKERFYGPCSGCRAVLRNTLGGEARDVEVAAYEPKMNVVPNQIATKD